MLIATDTVLALDTSAVFHLIFFLFFSLSIFSFPAPFAVLGQVMNLSNKQKLPVFLTKTFTISLVNSRQGAKCASSEILSKQNKTDLLQKEHNAEPDLMSGKNKQ